MGSTDTGQPWGFSKLPRELRDQIYGLTLLPRRRITKGKEPSNRSLEPHPYVNIYDYANPKLLRANRQINEEYAETAQKHTSIRIFTNLSWDLRKLFTDYNRLTTKIPNPSASAYALAQQRRTLSYVLGHRCHVTFEFDLGTDLGTGMFFHVELLPSRQFFAMQDHRTKVFFICRTREFVYGLRPGEVVLFGRRRGGETVDWLLSECEESYAWHGLFPEVRAVTESGIPDFKVAGRIMRST
ncbi:hypothetical protein LTR08_003760 [Meristemomyces frigidus]|nr:hypothetical protein LTR08_003760 [Meristemomyces frigidus]